MKKYNKPQIEVIAYAAETIMLSGVTTAQTIIPGTTVKYGNINFE